jgi:hypothetical protein
MNGSQVARAGAVLLFAAVAGIAVLTAAGSTAPAPLKPGESNNLCSTVKVAPTMPSDFVPKGAIDFQFSATCFAWHEFIYLNWKSGAGSVPDPAASPAEFGAPVTDPENAPTTVWESYADPDVVFGTHVGLLAKTYAKPGIMVLSATSKGDGDDVHLSGFHQAFTLGWLTSRNHDLTFYQERIDNDERDYILGNGLTTAKGQALCVQSPGGLNLPDGTNDRDCKGNVHPYGQHLGAIELKAAWIELHDPARYPKYLIARATLVYPNGTAPRQAVVGLVGLHIIRKLNNAKPFMWATFEHVDNDPDATPYPKTPTTEAPGASPTSTPVWTYYDSACKTNCAVNAGATPCAFGMHPPACQPYLIATQTQRVSPVSTFAAAATTTFRAALGRAGAQGSVFEHYRLIDMQWPTNPHAAAPLPRATIPLTMGAPAPTNAPVANTTMETYAQGASCMDCHTSATIATPHAAGTRSTILLARPGSPAFKALRSSGAYASDYSFVFRKAH